MSTSRTMPVKHIFLDIVGYTHNRSVEAQQEIIESLYEIVKDAVEELQIEPSKIIYLPTGDGVCISLVDIEAYYDVSIKLATNLLLKIYNYNNNTNDQQRKYQVRVGLSTNTDNIVTDINRNQNITGAGINMAQRVMNVGDGGHILISENVFETLRYREKYMKSFRGYSVIVKHNIPLKVYQYSDDKLFWINNETPSSLAKSKKENKLTKLVAYYFAFSIRYKSDLIKINNKSALYNSTLSILLFFLALDSNKLFEKSEFSKPTLYLASEKSIYENFDEIDKNDLWVKEELAEFIWRYKLARLSDCIEDSIFINKIGIDKLKNEYPEIWNEFNLDKLIN